MHVEAKESQERLIETQVSKEGVFTLVKQEDGVRIVIQNMLASDKVFKTYEDAEKYIKSKPYQLILIASYLYGNMVNKLQNEQAEYNKRNGNQADNSNTN